MTRPYRVCDRRGFLGIVIPFFLLGMVFVVGGVLSFLGPPLLNTGDASGNVFVVVVGTGVGGMPAFLGWQHLVPRPWMITIDPLDILALHRMFRVIRVPLADVRRVERRGRSVGVEGEDDRALVIKHRRGTVTDLTSRQATTS